MTYVNFLKCRNTLISTIIWAFFYALKIRITMLNISLFIYYTIIKTTIIDK